MDGARESKDDGGHKLASSEGSDDGYIGGGSLPVGAARGGSGGGDARLRRPAARSAATTGADRGIEDGFSAEEWLRATFSMVPSTALGWLRAGIGFHNKGKHRWAVEALQQCVAREPQNYNAYQVMARSCIALNRREDAVAALKESVKLGNPSDWQLLAELTSSGGVSPRGGGSGAGAAASAKPPRPTA